MSTQQTSSSPAGTPPALGTVLRERFQDCMDFSARQLGPADGRGGVTLYWIDGLVSSRGLAETVLHPLHAALCASGAPEAGACVEALLRGAVWAGPAQKRTDAEEVAQDLLHGCCAVLASPAGPAVCFEVKSEDGRAVSQPTIEKTVKGGKDAFVETLRTNTALVRKRLRTPRLKLIQTVLGRKSGTDVAVLYIEGVANPETVTQLRQRLQGVDIDGVTASGNLEQYLTDRPGCPFPQLLHTERPDTFASELLAGRVGLMADGLPLGFLLPATLSAFLHVSEDRAQHWLAASVLTLLRWFSLTVSLLLPALFTAIVMYHQEMIPTPLLLSIIEAKQLVPYSEAFEILGMLLAFELLMEAGLRLPDPVGDTVSIIGALIVGQSAVEAKVLSPISVIVVAVTAICGFTLPSRDLGAALRLLRLGLVAASIALGLYGLCLALALLLWYLCTVESFGVPYTAPMAEGGLAEICKAFLRLPLPADKLRERALRTPDRRNQK